MGQMSDDEQGPASQLSDGQCTQRHPYVRPVLQRLGSVRHLTLGATGRGGDFASLRGNRS